MISKVYDVDFYSIMTIFAQQNLGLSDTGISLDSGLEKSWLWYNNDAYIASLGLTSTINDMVSYAELYLEGSESYLRTASEPLYEISADTCAGYLWLVSKGTGVLSRSGSTSGYSAAIKIDPIYGTAVIVLSNYPDDRYGSTAELADALMYEKTGRT